jgi:hypothetical protein
VHERLCGLASRLNPPCSVEFVRFKTLCIDVATGERRRRRGRLGAMRVLEVAAWLKSGLS